MSDLVVIRDAGTVAAEIQLIQRQARKLMLVYAVEIGKRLVEAKELVPHGEWGRWLEESVSYSQSTANNMMALYREYGQQDQTSLFDDEANSQLLGKLSYTQALALMAVPTEERADFVAENHAEDLSVRELQEAIRQRDEAKAQAAQAAEDLSDMEDDLWDANKRADLERERAEEAERNLKNLQDTAGKAGDREADLEKKLSAAQVEKAKADAEAVDLQNKLAKAKSEADRAKIELDKAKRHPVIPDDMMANLRADAEKQAAAAAKDQAEKDLEKIRQDLEKAQAAAAAAEASRANAEKQLQEAQHAARMAAPSVAVFKSMFEALADQINRVNGHRLKTAQADPAAADSMTKALKVLLTKALEGL